MTSIAARLLARLHQDDHRLYHRWVLPEQHARLVRWGWVGVTHLGGARVTIATAVLVPTVLLPGSEDRWLPALALAVSFLLAQTVKRVVQRDRPARDAVIACPDRFSFPSGHATASLAVGLGTVSLVPAAASVVLPLALLVGWSRVLLGVHYPGDVLAGQIIAVLTVVALR